MIDQHERDQVRTAIGEFLDAAPSAPDRPPALQVHLASPTPERPGRRLFGALAAAAVVVIGLVGLVVLAGRTPSTTPADQPGGIVSPTDTATGPSVSFPDQLAASDWVITTELPPGLEFLYARRDGPTARSVAYGVPRGDGTDEELWIAIGESHDGTSTEPVTVDGIVWAIDWSNPGWWSAWRRIDGTELNVRGPATAVPRVLSSLTVVDEADLPSTPLGDPEKASVVATTDLDGVVYSYARQESGRYTCNWLTTSVADFSVGCGSRTDPSAVVTIDIGTMSASSAGLNAADTGPDDAVTIDVVSGGTVSTTAASVEVEFVDGTTVTVQPTDLSGIHDSLFWVAATTISTDVPTRPDSGELVAEVRAYDAAGHLLGTATRT